ncbi:MAG: creatininase family protein [Woeseiaceae bacterium]|nr:creatininase family protein [Woeseiaceae bacterium]
MKFPTLLACISLTMFHTTGIAEDSVFLEELTWTEIRDMIENGTTRVLIPTAGTEQNGPHMVLGKHRYIIEHASDLIARELGRTLVAPTMVYVPEGSIDPPTGHMRYPGTISLPNEHFVKVLEYTARSLAAHGFTDILFLSDSGSNVRGIVEVTEALSREWVETPARAHDVSDYYANNGIQEWLESEGETPDAIGTHAGIKDTSQLWYVNPQHIRTDKLAYDGGFENSGVRGDPTRASRDRGRKGIELKVEAAVRQARMLLNKSRRPVDALDFMDHST